MGASSLLSRADDVGNGLNSVFAFSISALSALSDSAGKGKDHARTRDTETMENPVSHTFEFFISTSKTNPQYCHLHQYRWHALTEF